MAKVLLNVQLPLHNLSSSQDHVHVPNDFGKRRSRVGLLTSSDKDFLDDVSSRSAVEYYD